MRQENMEMYMGAVYRLRKDAVTPVAISDLHKYFNFSPISIHEMVKKLQKAGYLLYHRYQGVCLTPAGEEIASALVRRHRIWERFLADELSFSPEEVHAIACSLEHAAPQEVTDRLAERLGEPDACPHGAAIPPSGEAR